MDAQKGWRRCSLCQGLVNVLSLNGSCVGGGMHEFLGSAEYKAAWGTVEAGAQAGWGACQKCAGLAFKPGGGVCHDGSPHEFAEYDAEYSVSTLELPAMQPGWRWCNKCQRLWDGSHPAGLCFAGGNHDATGSWAYTVPFEEAALQADWFWCQKCQGLIRGMEQLGCVDQSRHEVRGTWYRVAFGAAPVGTQQGWRYCRKCTSLVFSDGACFMGSEHEFSESLSYSIPVEVEPVDAQPGWRWCGKCQTLSYSGFAVGPCPAGGIHDQSTSGKYSVYPDSLNNGQAGWRLCTKCRTMTLSSVSPGPCRDGSIHDLTGSPAYQVPEGGVPFGADSSWHWCHRCQGLAHGGPSFDGICFDQLPHDYTESTQYGVPIDPAPEGGQTGWQRCVVCKQLALPAEDGSTGMCVNGTVHDFSGSPTFTLAMTAPLEPEPAQFATLALTEAETQVVADGAGFTAGASVEISFIAGAVTAKVDVSVDDAGAFHLEQQPVVPAPATGGLVIARESADKVASGRLKNFVPAPTQ
jgi:hypothetical protein